MGRRTKFQTEDKAQLVLKIERSEGALYHDATSVDFSELPKVCRVAQAAH